MKNFFGLFFLVLIIGSCDQEKDNKVLFSYKGILDREYRFNIGKVVPLVSEKAVEFSGNISMDGLYFYYTSNRARGNYDLYLRDLTSITTVRLTNHPSKDFCPVISPDGKKLVFISTREDPEGDLYLAEINSTKIISRFRKGNFFPADFEKAAVNLTQVKDFKQGGLKIVKDSSPAWSPDGKKIIFSSSREGQEDLWLFDLSQRSFKRLTTKGGDYPNWSLDGQELLFISYREKNRKGDIFSLNLSTEKEKRITNSPAIELYPFFGKNKNEIIYTSIEEDSNEDGRLDLKDNSVLMFKDLKNDLTYPLTLSSVSSFAAKWMPVYKIGNYQGVIVYATAEEDNINLNIIPEKGIIPKKTKAKLQFKLAERYLREEVDQEKYLLALERVYSFFSDRKDKISKIYIARAWKQAAKIYQKEKKYQKIREFKELSQRLDNKDFYVLATQKYLTTLLKEKRGVEIFGELISSLRKTENQFYLPYLLEDLADEYVAIKNLARARKIYQKIIREHQTYKNILEIHTKLTCLLKNRSLSPSVWQVFKKGSEIQKIRMQKHLLENFTRRGQEKDNNHFLQKILAKHQEHKKFLPLVFYALAKNFLNQGQLTKAQENLLKTQKNSNSKDFIYYQASILLGEIAVRQKNMSKAEQYYYEAVNKYKNLWQLTSFTEKVNWLLNYYEKNGKKRKKAKTSEKQVALLQKYTRLMSYVKRKKYFKEIYNCFGPQAQVRYIDAFLSLKGVDKIDDLLNLYLNDLTRARLDFDKAYLYGLGYLYTQRALFKEKVNFSETVLNFELAIQQIDWAIFLDDTFVEPFLLKSWIYQYLDLKRGESPEDFVEVINDKFPKYLWEENISLLTKILEANDERQYPDNEGNINLNLANSYFLLGNYGRALGHYREVSRYKNKFSSKNEEALFYFHFGYCYWQAGQLARAEQEMGQALDIYEILSMQSGGVSYRFQVFSLYKYFALFKRQQGDFQGALKWYQRIFSWAEHYNFPLDRVRYKQEMSYCRKQEGEIKEALKILEGVAKDLEQLEYQPDKYQVQFQILDLFSFSFYDLGLDRAVIGPSKILGELNKRQKRLLNLSLQEEIFWEQQDYYKIINLLKKKIKVADEEKSSFDQEVYQRALNNLGYAYFMLKDYEQAELFFKKAYQELKEQEKVLSGEGLNIIFNLANLYTLVNERNLNIFSESEIKKYFLELVDSKKKFGTEMEQNFYKLDIILGTLLYAQGLLNSQGIIKNFLSPISYYKKEDFSFGLYDEAGSYLEKSLAIAREKEDQKFLLKGLAVLRRIYHHLFEFQKEEVCRTQLVKLKQKSNN